MDLAVKKLGGKDETEISYQVAYIPFYNVGNFIYPLIGRMEVEKSTCPWQGRHSNN